MTPNGTYEQYRAGQNQKRMEKKQAAPVKLEEEKGTGKIPHQEKQRIPAYKGGPKNQEVGGNVKESEEFLRSLVPSQTSKRFHHRLKGSLLGKK